jgi:hypothetical protein
MVLLSLEVFGACREEPQSSGSASFLVGRKGEMLFPFLRRDKYQWDFERADNADCGAKRTTEFECAREPLLRHCANEFDDTQIGRQCDHPVRQRNCVNLAASDGHVLSADAIG